MTEQFWVANAIALPCSSNTTVTQKKSQLEKHCQATVAKLLGIASNDVATPCIATWHCYLAFYSSIFLLLYTRGLTRRGEPWGELHKKIFPKACSYSMNSQCGSWIEQCRTEVSERLGWFQERKDFSSPNKCPFEWVEEEEVKETYEILAVLARQFLAVPVTSAPS